MSALWTTVRFLFWLEGIPVGTVALSVSQPDAKGLVQYEYRSRHWFDRGGAVQLEQHARFQVRTDGTLADGEARPVSLALLHKHPPGCFAVREELGAETGKLCVESVKAGDTRGTVLGQKYAASYGNKGELSELKLGASRFERVDSEPTMTAPANPFDEGFAIVGSEGRLALRPSLPEANAGKLTPWSKAKAKALERSVHESFTEKTPSKADMVDDETARVGSCLAHAKRYVAQANRDGPHAEVVYGLLVDQGRAYPHAWIRVAIEAGKTLELDPSSREPVTPRTHLALQRPGETYLALMKGKQQVIRSP